MRTQFAGRLSRWENDAGAVGRPQARGKLDHGRSCQEYLLASKTIDEGWMHLDHTGLLNLRHHFCTDQPLIQNTARFTISTKH
jgi:hypothetical protein